MHSKIVIGVLSKLENFERRKTIRSTWKKLVSEDVVFHFILGDTFCPHNKLWRLSNENCNEWKLEVNCCPYFEFSNKFTFLRFHNGLKMGKFFPFWKLINLRQLRIINHMKAFHSVSCAFPLFLKVLES